MIVPGCKPPMSSLHLVCSTPRGNSGSWFDCHQTRSSEFSLDQYDCPINWMVSRIPFNITSFSSGHWYSTNLYFDPCPYIMYFKPWSLAYFAINLWHPPFTETPRPRPATRRCANRRIWICVWRPNAFWWGWRHRKFKNIMNNPKKSFEHLWTEYHYYLGIFQVVSSHLITDHWDSRREQRQRRFWRHC